LRRFNKQMRHIVTFKKFIEQIIYCDYHFHLKQ